MKIVKKLFYGIMVIIMMICAGVLILAFSPDMTKNLSETLYGENGLLAGVGKGSDARETDVEPGQIPDEIAREYQIAEGVLAGDFTANYVAPVRGALNLPDAVSKKSGYQPVRGDAQELAEEQLEALGSQLETGETGDNLTFDAAYYPFYHMLNATMQHLYRQIYANAIAGNTTFAPVEPVTTAQLKNVFEAVYNDHPELFWLDTGYSCKYRAGGQCVEITLAYNRTAQNLDQAKKEFEAAAQKILDAANRKSSPLAKEEYVHDELIRMASYSVSSAMNQSAYSALVSGDTVCAGYSRAFQYLLQQLQIPCYYCTGYSGEDHAWNIVKLGDDYYNVDVTWDDTDPATYDYFNKSDAQFVGTHVRTGLSVYLPPCGIPTEGSAGGSTFSDSQTVAGITLNPNPQQPLSWKPEPEKPEKAKRSYTTDGDDLSYYVSGGDVYDMSKAGISGSAVQNSMKAYYANCLKQMVDRGTGQQAFSNVVPKYVLKEVERSYGTGAYQKGYVQEGLKQLGVENFAIQIQVRDLGGNYYRLYHNVYTW